MDLVFISYRRSDAKTFAHRLHDRLRREFGASVFMDVSGIEPGADFPRVLDEQLRTCRVLIAIIGDEWLDVRNATGQRRLDDPRDYVRIEVSKALATPAILVVPVLVNGTPMPAAAALPNDLIALPNRNAVPVDDDRFEADLKRLIAVLEPIVPRKSRWPRRIAAGIVAIAVAAGAVWIMDRLDPGAGVRLVPGAALFAQLPAEQGTSGMRYDLIVDATATLRDVTRSIVYTGADAADLERLKARQDGAQLGDHLLSHFTEEGVDDGAALAAQLQRSALVLPTSAKEHGEKIQAEIFRYDASAGAAAQPQRWFECTFDVREGDGTFFLAPQSEHCRGAAP